MNHPILFTEETGRLRVSWDNRLLRKESFTYWFFIVFWIIWAPATCYATWQIFQPVDRILFIVWSVFGWLGTYAIPATLAQRRWREWIELDAAKITWGARGPLAGPPRSLPLSGVGEFGLGRNSSRTEHESISTLNIYEAPGKLGSMRRHLLGYWLNADHKERIFERLQEFVARNSIPLKLVTYPTEEPAGEPGS